MSCMQVFKLPTRYMCRTRRKIINAFLPSPYKKKDYRILLGQASMFACMRFIFLIVGALLVLVGKLKYFFPQSLMCKVDRSLQFCSSCIDLEMLLHGQQVAALCHQIERSQASLIFHFHANKENNQNRKLDYLAF